MTTKDAAESTVIDASGLILGRMASKVAKRLLLGEPIIIVNAEKATLSGRRLSRVKEAKEFLKVGHPGKGPFHPRRPDQIVRRTVRGMLPRRKPKGANALRRLRVFLGVPSELKTAKMQTIPDAHVGKLKCPYVTIEEFAKQIGYKPEGE
ncbi:MAG TPA: 50S ribosomal protein L13 [Candidatus Bathyarchaeia archaeon]|nr:50S ribosomal protein L13 [Candidatus Bathyarchaeia archaeon]